MGRLLVHGGYYLPSRRLYRQHPLSLTYFTTHFEVHSGKGIGREKKKCMFCIGEEGGEGRFYQALMCCLPSSPFWRESLQGHPIYIFSSLEAQEGIITPAMH